MHGEHLIAMISCCSIVNRPDFLPGNRAPLRADYIHIGAARGAEAKNANALGPRRHTVLDEVTYQPTASAYQVRVVVAVPAVISASSAPVAPTR